MPRPDVLALRYASRPENLASHTFYRHELYAEPDGPYRMDYFFWVVREQNSTTVVDCGYNRERGAARNRHIDTDLTQLLARVGVVPEEVDHVVLSHLHFDHVGNLDLFPSARFAMSRPEYDHWTGPYGQRRGIQWPVEPVEVDQVRELHEAGRLDLFDEQTRLTDAVTLTTLPGHTPGQVVTTVATGAGRSTVIASDAAHFYDELDLDRPFYIHNDLVQMYQSYEHLRALDAREAVDVVPGHDPLVAHLYDEVETDCFDLTSPTVASRSELRG